MSSTTTPITPELFALAIKDLPSSSLHFKARELRNSLAHLDYSNQQLIPYTDGTNGEPDQDCIDAIKENEIVIERHNERLGLLKVEVESRGMNWREFMSSEELEEQQENDSDTNGDMMDDEGHLVNGHGADHGNGTNGASARAGTNGTESRTAAATTESTQSPWTDGTFTTGTISSNGNVSVNTHTPPPQRIVIQRILTPASNRPPEESSGRTPPPFRSDAELRRALAERMEEDNEEDGMHL